MNGTGAAPRSVRLSAALGLGANLGDRRTALNIAVARIIADRRVGTVRRSSFYATEPVGGPEQPEYLNVVVVLDCVGSRDPLPVAEHLLRLAHTIERDLQRTRAVRWGPRTIDVDVLAVGGLITSDPHLTVPHPRIAERAFVLVPWAEVAPEFEVPGLGAVADLLAALPPSSTRQVRRL